MSTPAGCRVMLGLVLLVAGAAPLPAQQKKKVSVEGLIYDLRHPEPDRRQQAAALLGEHRVREAVPALIELTGDADNGVRREAVRALVRINDPRALGSYIRLTRDLQREIQEKSIEGIINLYVVDEKGFVQGVKKLVQFVNPFSDDYNPLMVEPYMPVSQEAIQALADLLTSPEQGLRKDAAVALGILRARSVLPAIEQAMARETGNAVKVELIRAIYKIGDPQGGRALIPFIRDPDKTVHDEAIFTVGRLRVSEAAPHLKQLYESDPEEQKKIFGILPVTGKDDLQRNLLQAMAYIGDPACREIFLNTLNDQRDFYRRFAAEGLGRMGDSTLSTLLARKYLRESSSSTKLALGFALFLLGRDEHLLEMVDNLDKEQVFHYLLELPPREIEKLYPHARNEYYTARVRLLEIIGLRGGASALPVVEEMMSHPNPEIAGAANLAARRLRGRLEEL